jgi:hypothetical protein
MSLLIEGTHRIDEEKVTADQGMPGSERGDGEGSGKQLELIELPDDEESLPPALTGGPSASMRRGTSCADESEVPEDDPGLLVDYTVADRVTERPSDDRKKAVEGSGSGA